MKSAVFLSPGRSADMQKDYASAGIFSLQEPKDCVPVADPGSISDFYCHSGQKNEVPVFHPYNYLSGSTILYCCQGGLA